jgi:predicted esterase
MRFRAVFLCALAALVSAAPSSEARDPAGSVRPAKLELRQAKLDTRPSKLEPRPPKPDPNALGKLDIAGGAPAYYYQPIGARGLRPVLLFLHGRGGNPQRDCEKWGRVAREFGWVICPSGPEDRGDGARGWANNWMASKSVVDKAMAALRDKFARRVQLRGNTLIGFSEGAYVAMNVGVREPEVFNRWLILAANDDYWGGEGTGELEKRYAHIKRVYLLTGERDEVVGSTRRVFQLLDDAGVHVMMRIPEDLAHEIPEDRMRTLYRRPLRWLNSVD